MNSWTNAALTKYSSIPAYLECSRRLHLPTVSPGECFWRPSSSSNLHWGVTSPPFVSDFRAGCRENLKRKSLQLHCRMFSYKKMFFQRYTNPRCWRSQGPKIPASIQTLYRNKHLCLCRSGSPWWRPWVGSSKLAIRPSADPSHLWPFPQGRRALPGWGSRACEGGHGGVTTGRKPPRTWNLLAESCPRWPRPTRGSALVDTFSEVLEADDFRCLS